MAVEVKELLEAGVHFGHLTRKWDPNMAPYVYMERNGIHIINLYKTAAKIDEAGAALAKIAASGRKILFVATKKQAKDIVAEKAGGINMPYITERWPGGMLTNFVLSLIHISEPTRPLYISYAVFCLKKNSRTWSSKVAQ